MEQMPSDCIFCKIARGDIPCTKIFENEQVMAFLDINPWAGGHSLIIPKEHFARLEECSPAALAALAAPLPALSRAIMQAVGAEACNVLMNNGRSAGQLVDHVHLHLIPRRPDDRIIRHAPQKTYPEGQMNDIAEHIKKRCRLNL